MAVAGTYGPANTTWPRSRRDWKSLEELEVDSGGVQATRRARSCSGQREWKVGQQGAIADYLEVDKGTKRAVAKACLGDLLQHVIVERPEHAEAVPRPWFAANKPGRCGVPIAGDWQW
jgi:chromosome segregation ATPase